MNETVERVVKKAVMDTAKLQGEAKRSMSLHDDLGLDVIDMAYLLLFLEEELGVDIVVPDDVETVGDLIETVQRCAGRVG